MHNQYNDFSYNEKKQLIDKVTYNGKFYYQFHLPQLIQKSSDAFKNISSPFRTDENPSLSVYLNKDINDWRYNDFGSPDTHGDYLNFASKIHNLDIKNDFPKIIDSIAHEIGLDRLSGEEVEKILAIGCGTNEVQTINFKIKGLKLRPKKYIDTDDTPECIIFCYDIPFDKLGDLENTFLGKYNISTEIMKACNTSFISGYEHVYSNKRVITKKPTGVIWLCYKKGRQYYKIYCPHPKKFWSIGRKESDYFFGKNAINICKENNDKVVILAAGEKDTLVLLSRDYKAFCLNSETENLPITLIENWIVDNGFKIVTIYDIDDTGIAQAKLLREKYHLPFVLLPDWLAAKGGKDISDYFFNGGKREELSNLILDALNLKEHPKNLSRQIKPVVRTAIQRMDDAKHLPDINPHFDVFFQSNELVIFFGDTGKGKSILAVALADAISKGICFMALENLCEPLKVLYYDFELSDKQFWKRYTNAQGDCYEFSPNFFIDNIDISKMLLLNEKLKFEQIIINKIREDLKETEARVLIIDNITFLTSHSPEDSEVAMVLMKLLKELKVELNISILVLAHTPKKHGSGGISLPDLAGSKHLSNFADSVFSLGVSKKDISLRYLIQVKPSRSAEVKYDSDNVFLCEIDKDGPLLTFIGKGLAKEGDHLFSNSPDTEKELIEKAKEFQSKGLTYRDIAKELNVSKSSVGRWLKV